MTFVFFFRQQLALAKKQQQQTESEKDEMAKKLKAAEDERLRAESGLYYTHVSNYINSTTISTHLLYYVRNLNL
jgi:hypothetical protein